MRLFLCCLVVAFAVSACCSPEGCPEATTCRAAQNRLADAVESHRLSDGGYPTSLADVPIDAGKDLSYSATDGGFEIECTYTGPGFNRCTLDEKRMWSCYGYS